MTMCIPPLLPPDCDLTDFGYMPLDVRRLRDSKLASHVTGDEFRAAVLLWCASWHQVPAGSLPDDDGELAQFSGYGRVVKEWLKIRKGALHGWIKCSDGRLWHPVVAGKAMEAWNQKRDHAWAKECDRLRKENKQREADNREKAPLPERPPRISIGKTHCAPPETLNASAGSPELSDGIPDENALKGKEGKEERKKPPLPPRGGVRQQKNPIPPDWRPSEAGATYARERGVDLAVQVPKFVRHHLGNDSRRADFSPYWLNWCDGDLSAKHPKSADPDLAGKQTAMLEGWLKRLRDHHGEAINGTSVADVDRVYRKFSGVNFLGFLDAVEAGEAWLLDELHSGAAA